MALTTALSFSFSANYVKAFDLGNGGIPFSLSVAISLASGTGANQADKIWGDRRTINASATDSIDLAGVLTDAYGDALTFAKLKAIVVSALGANTNNVNVTRPGSNGVPLFLAAGDGIPVLPGGVFVWAAPNAAAITVTAGTGDLIDLVNSAGGTSVTYDILLVGTSA